MKEKNFTPLIYVIEDEESISKLVCMYLSKSEMNTKPFFNAEDALTELKNNIIPDLIVLDLNLPGMSGFEFLEKFRKEFDKAIPVIILSARDADEDIIKGLGYGADEFVTKPFSPSVLVARVKANLRRQIFASAKAEESISFDDYTLLLNSCVLKKGNHKVPLSSKEYEVLEYLLKHAGETLSPDKIYTDVWKVKYGDVTAVAVYIQRLRKKIETASKVYIRTEFGKGYIFTKDCVTINK
ncbi:MAG: response regulator transcription factor [Treponema sp.]|nr:response regulator transcription factor [Treponema sp.]